jgi:hypothetical protein
MHGRIILGGVGVGRAGVGVARLNQIVRTGLESTYANICLARHHSIRVGFCAFGPVEVDTGISSLGRFDLLVCSNSIPKKNAEAIM